MRAFGCGALAPSVSTIALLASNVVLAQPASFQDLDVACSEAFAKAYQARLGTIDVKSPPADRVRAYAHLLEDVGVPDACRRAQEALAVATQTIRLFRRICGLKPYKEVV